MFKTYLKIAWYNIRKHKIYSIINVLGLALGTTGCIVIYLVTSHELSFDSFHPDKERIYRITSQLGSGKLRARVPPPAPAALRKELSGVEAVSGSYPYYARIAVRDSARKTRSFDSQVEGTDGTTCVIFTDSNYFRIFHYSWLAGNQAASLNAPFQVVLTESKARSYFGDLTPAEMLGKEVVYDDSIIAHVSGVIGDWKEKTDFPHTDFLSLPTIASGGLDQTFPGKWAAVRGNSWMWCFVKISKSSTPAQIIKQLATFITRHQQGTESDSLKFALEPLTSIHFHDNVSGDDIRKAHLPTLYGLLAIAIFILVIAVINFINLSTAQSLRRSKEIAIRKVLGSSRKSLIFQYLTETFVITFFSVCLALLFVNPALRLLNDYIPYGVSFHLLLPFNLLFIAIMIIVTSLLAGFYPAWVLASYKPAANLKDAGTKKGGEKWWLRKGLIVFQFSASLVFIISTFVIGRQVRFMLNTDYGFKSDAIVNLLTNWRDSSSKIAVLMQELRQLPAVGQIIREGDAPIGWGHGGGPLKYKTKNGMAELTVEIDAGNDDFIPFYQMRLVAGRNLVHSDSLKEFVINETCAKALGYPRPEQAIGQFLFRSDGAYPIVGVIRDFHESSFRNPIGPLVIGQIPESENEIGIKLAASQKGAANLEATLEGMRKVWKKVYPNRQFRYSFMDESIADMYGEEQDTSALMQIFMFLTIFISCMGLFGLAMFSTEKRTKEIGIRKVLGAGITEIAAMLSWDFIKLVILAFCIASPIAWYLMHKWMQDFVYRVDISWWIFLSAGALAVLIAMITICYQTLKAAIANPINSLKVE
jgi:putative ABC transport system permease protein